MTEGGSQGLFVVVAVIIFGIFVSIAYLLFDDTLKPSLAGIFKDGIFQAEKRLVGSGVEYVPGGVDDALKVDLNGEDNVKENNGYIYLRLRDNTVETSGQEIWAKTKVKTDDSNGMQYIAIQQVSTSFLGNETGFTYGTIGMKGNLTIPDTVTFSNGAVLPILEIENQAFENATFNGEFTANGVRKIGDRAFEESQFKTYSAKNLEDVGNRAFYKSTFINDAGIKSNFNSSKIKNAGASSYESAKFTGDFVANEVDNVGDRAFMYSNFNNKFEAEKVKTIGDNAYEYSTFVGDFIVNDLESVGSRSFSTSKFNGNLEMAKLNTIKSSAFFKSEFKGNFKAPELVSIGTKAFAYSLFTDGDFIAPKLKTIEAQAFSDDYSSDEGGYTTTPKKMFQKGTFDAPMLETVGGKGLRYAYFSEKTPETTFEHLKSAGFQSFYNSSFTGNINLNKLTRVGKSAFEQAKFTGNLTINNVKTLPFAVFYGSNFTELEAENLTSVDDSVFYKSKFTTVNAPNLTKAKVIYGNGNLIDMLPN